jgi:protoporphyrinogen oxidase
VVGGGISGLIAALLLARRGERVELWEETRRLGGLIAPIPFRGVDCDVGSHRVHPECDPLLLELTEDAGWMRRPRRGAIVIGGRRVRYPLGARDFLRGLGPRNAAAMLGGLLAAPGRARALKSWEADRRTTADEDEGFEDFVRARAGSAAYEVFYRPYIEKVWGIDPSELSRTVAKQRVSTLRPFSAAARSLMPKKARPGFLYPRHGMAALLELLREQLEVLGVTTRTGVRFDADTAREVKGDFRATLFSGRLRDITQRPALDHRGLYLLHLAFDQPRLGTTDTWYFPDGAVPFGRVSETSLFSPALSPMGESLLCVEIPEGRHGPEARFDQRAGPIVDALRHHGVVPAKARLLAVHQEYRHDVYPLYLRGWLDGWREALDEVATLGNVIPFGRQGLFLHCNLDHCAAMAAAAVDHAQADLDPTRWRARAEAMTELRVRD